MSLSNSTVSVIIAALSADNVRMTGDEVRDAFDRSRSGPARTSIDLQPGEVYVLKDQDDRGYCEEYTTRETLMKVIEDFAEECVEDRRDIDDRITVFIKRCDVNVSVSSKVTVILD